MEKAVPARRVIVQVEIGVYLMIASLAIFFIGGLAAFLIVRNQTPNLPAGSGEFPAGLWVSTAFLIAGSVSIQKALSAVKRERQLAFRRWLVAAGVLGTLFLISQSLSLWQLLEIHWQVLGKTRIWGFLFLLILLHAIHFLFGLGALLMVIYHGLRGRFDHEFYSNVKLVAVYWHFLDAVWLAMLATFLFTT
ncbi:MAG: hypothetical protein C0478_17555 [Planctomyces sp.]|nr:hypothetical protein [Planctomyces sp.]